MEDTPFNIEDAAEGIHLEALDEVEDSGVVEPPPAKRQRMGDTMVDRISSIFYGPNNSNDRKRDETVRITPPTEDRPANRKAELREKIRKRLHENRALIINPEIYKMPDLADYTEDQLIAILNNFDLQERQRKKLAAKGVAFAIGGVTEAAIPKAAGTATSYSQDTEVLDELSEYIPDWLKPISGTLFLGTALYHHATSNIRNNTAKIPATQENAEKEAAGTHPAHDIQNQEATRIFESSS